MSCTPNRTEGPANPHPSLVDVLSGIEPSLPESLFGEECRSQMKRVAASLPMRLSHFWGFECRLGDPEPLSDILFEIEKKASGPAFLAGETSSALDGLCEVHPVWEKLRSFARDWTRTNPAHPWNRDVRNLWLEMDLAAAGDVETVLRKPSVFFGPEPETPSERIFELIGELSLLFERPSGHTRALREFFDCLPEEARVFQIGLMLSREDDVGIRLCVDKVEPEEMLPWFARLWPGMNAAETESLREVFETLFPLCRSLNAGFNLTEDGVGNGWGVECYEDWLDENPSQWRPLLDELKRAGVCLPEKAQVVMDYAGITASPLRERITDGIVYLNTYRKIHHLKLTLSREILTQAKAYLAVSRPGLPLSFFGLLKAMPGVSGDADRLAEQAWSTR